MSVLLGASGPFSLINSIDMVDFTEYLVVLWVGTIGMFSLGLSIAESTESACSSTVSDSF